MSITVEAPTPVRPRSSGRGFGPLLLRLHFYAGLLVAPFLFVAATTGLAYVFAPQLDRIVYGHELTVGHPGGPVLALSRQVSAARATHPAGTIAAVRPGTGSETTQVDFTAPGLDEEHFHTVYVNPYTGAINGQLTTWYAATPLKEWLDATHRNLHLGVAGRYYSEFAASWLWILALGGLALWWRRQRGRRMLTPDLAARKGVRRTRSWHAALGVWLAVGLLLLSATGLTWSRYAGGHFQSLVDSLSAGTPSVSTALPSAPAPAAMPQSMPGMVMPGDSPASTAPATVDPALIDGVLTAARTAGIDGPVEIDLPADTATAWTVNQTRNLWPVGRDSVAVDPGTGTIVDRVDFADWPLMAKLTRWGINAHMGTLLGLPNQLLLAALALGIMCVIVWGYRMWWQRRPTRADRRAPVGRPLADRGAWQRLPTWAIVVGVPVMLAVGWALPLFGVPLALFLIADLLIGAIKPKNARV